MAMIAFWNRRTDSPASDSTRNVWESRVAPTVHHGHAAILADWRATTQPFPEYHPNPELVELDGRRINVMPGALIPLATWMAWAALSKDARTECIRGSCRPPVADPAPGITLPGPRSAA